MQAHLYTYIFGKPLKHSLYKDIKIAKFDILFSFYVFSYVNCICQQYALKLFWDAPELPDIILYYLLLFYIVQPTVRLYDHSKKYLNQPW